MKHISVPKRKELGSHKPIIRAGLIIVLGFFGTFVLWTFLAQMEGAIIAPGIIKVAQNRKAVQHLEGGIIKQIVVKDGDKVQKGDPLLVLDSVQIESNVDLLQGQYYTFAAKQARLEAQRNLSDTIIWPEKLLADAEKKDVSEIVEAEEKVFTSQKDMLKGQVHLLGTQTKQIQQQIIGLRERIKSEDDVIAALREELVAKEELYRQRYLEKTPVLELRRQLASHEGNQAVSKREIAQAEERITELEVRANELQNAYIQQAVTELSDVQTRLFDVQDRLRPQVDAKKRLVLSAPVSGTIVDSQVFSTGGVIRPGEIVLSIVPEEEPLIIECNVETRDIAKVYTGQKARVELNAFNLREVMPVDGEVSYVSADSVMIRSPYGEHPIFRANVTIHKDQVAAQHLELSPGMPATVFLNTGKRTFFDYIMEPLTQNFRRALRE